MRVLGEFTPDHLLDPCNRQRQTFPLCRCKEGDHRLEIGGEDHPPLWSLLFCHVCSPFPVSLFPLLPKPAERILWSRGRVIGITRPTTPLSLPLPSFTVSRSVLAAAHLGRAAAEIVSARCRR